MTTKFRVSPVMTTSISLRVYRYIITQLKRECKMFFAFFLKKQKLLMLRSDLTNGILCVILIKTEKGDER